MESPTGRVCGIAFRPEGSAVMRDISVCTVEAKRGLTVEDRHHGKREITLLSQEAWSAVCRDMGQEIAWTTRRANILVAGIDLGACIGKTLLVGHVRVYVHGETKPCRLMDDQVPGLRQALKPDCRGGVHGQVTHGGTIRTGDPVTVHTAGSEPNH